MNKLMSLSSFGHSISKKTWSLKRSIANYPINHENPKEVRIPLAYGGHMAAKHWTPVDSGPEDKLILGLHGWLDNAGTMDRLAPYLPKGYKFVSLDLPGHGLSSHIPPGMQYSMYDVFNTIETARSYFGVEKLSLIGHSMGGGLSQFYSIHLPEYIDKIIAIDLIFFPLPIDISNHIVLTSQSFKDIQKVFKKLAKNTAPEYDYETAVSKALAATTAINGKNAVSRDSVEILMKRGLTKTPSGKFTWTVDPRLKITVPSNFVWQQVEHYAQNLKVPFLLVFCEDSNSYVDKESVDKIIGLLKGSNPKFVYSPVKGGHFVHLNYPERIIPAINKFLSES